MRTLPVCLLLLSCSGGSDAVDCAEAADFTPCELDEAPDAAARCLATECTQVPDCPDDSCASRQYFPVPDSGMTACFGPTEGVPEPEITCPTQVGTQACADTAHCGQDAQYGWDTTHDASERWSFDDADERVVVDQVTGLVWQGCAMGQGPGCQGPATQGPWAEAQAYCEGLSWGGHEDWILPDVYALQSITDFSTTAPAIDTAAFASAPSNHPADDEAWWKECTWSSTDKSSDATIAWATLVNSGDVLLGSGVPYHPHDKAAEGWDGCYTRCMRRPDRPNHARWVRAGTADEAVWVDIMGERMWPACSIGQSGADCSGEATQLPWEQALSACEALSWGGFEDWRLANVLELRSLVDVGRSQPAIDPERFPNTPRYDGVDDLRSQYWSSTVRSYNDFALYVSFLDGGSHFYKQPEGRHVRCVR